MMAAQLEALHQEMIAATKKAPDKPISAFKIGFVNAILEQAKLALGSSTPRLKFTEFDSDDLPTSSDVNFIVGQFIECVDKVKCENISRNHDGVWYWRVDGQLTSIIATPPKGVK